MLNNKMLYREALEILMEKSILLIWNKNNVIFNNMDSNLALDIDRTAKQFEDLSY